MSTISREFPMRDKIVALFFLIILQHLPKIFTTLTENLKITEVEITYIINQFLFDIRNVYIKIYGTHKNK